MSTAPTCPSASTGRFSPPPTPPRPTCAPWTTNTAASPLSSANAHPYPPTTTTSPDPNPPPSPPPCARPPPCKHCSGHDLPRPPHQPHHRHHDRRITRTHLPRTPRMAPPHSRRQPRGGPGQSRLPPPQPHPLPARHAGRNRPVSITISADYPANNDGRPTKVEVFLD